MLQSIVDEEVAKTPLLGAPLVSCKLRLVNNVLAAKGTLTFQQFSMLNILLHRVAKRLEPRKFFFKK